jgi:hypothetical protein
VAATAVPAAFLPTLVLLLLALPWVFSLLSLPPLLCKSLYILDVCTYRNMVVGYFGKAMKLELLRRNS